jgi:cobalt/nickel transport system permease protein
LQKAKPQSSLKRGRNVIERTLQGISETLERSIFAEEISGRSGLLQSLDPRVKVIATLALLIGVSLSRSLVVIAAIYGLALVLAILSAIPGGFFIKRVWLVLPFFTGLIILPALFITPGPPLVQLPFGLVITRTGLVSALFLLLRVSTSVSLTLLLILTTPWNSVLSALSVMRIPDVFILILGMTYRKSRLVGRLDSTEQRHIIAATSATLLSKSLNMSSEVYLAMQSRGFRGSVVTLKPFKMNPRDWLWGAVLLSVAVIAIILGR